MNHFNKPAIFFYLIVMTTGCAKENASELSFRERVALLTRQRQKPDALNSYILAEIAYENGDLDQAIPLMEAARKVDDSDPFLSLRLAALYYETGNQPRAETEIAAVLKDNPRHFGAWLSRSKGRYQAGDKAGALHAARQVMKLAPHYPEGALWLARLLEESGEKGAAESVLRQFLEYRPDHLLVSVALCRLLLEQKKYRSAITIANRIQTSRNVPSTLFLDLGRSARRHGYERTSARLYERAFSTSKPTEKARIELIDIYLAAGNTERAVFHLHALSVLENTDFEPHLVHAVRWDRAGKPYEARKVLLNGLDLIPEEPHLTLYLAAVEIELARLEDATLLLESDLSWTQATSACRDELRNDLAEWPDAEPDCPIFHLRESSPMKPQKR